MGSGIFHFDIKAKLLNNFILSNSSWNISGCCMSIRNWQEGVLPHKMDFLQTEIQIYNLPPERININNGLDLGRQIGYVVAVDDDVYYNELGALMRIKLSLSAKKPLPLDIRFHQQKRWS